MGLILDHLHLRGLSARLGVARCVRCRSRAACHGALCHPCAWHAGGRARSDA